MSFMTEEQIRDLIQDVKEGHSIIVSKQHYQEIYEAMDWMIKALEFSDKNTGMHGGDSDEMKEAKRVRDIVGLDFPIKGAKDSKEN